MPRKQQKGEQSPVIVREHNTIGPKLRRMRIRAGATRYYVESQLGLDWGELNGIESGFGHVNERLLQEYLDVLDNLRENSLPNSMDTTWIMTTSPPATGEFVDDVNY